MDEPISIELTKSEWIDILESLRRDHSDAHDIINTKIKGQLQEGINQSEQLELPVEGGL